jgi:N,N'-diacetyllegionaminate synthase
MIKIGNKEISNGSKPYIVAEVGINHNGDIDKAFSMIEIAKKSGCDAVKFQTFSVEELILDPELTYTFKSQGKETTESMIDLFTKYELKEDDWFKIKEKCNLEKITFLSTPQNISDLEILLKVGIDAIKVGSDDFNNIHLIKKYTETKLPLILSSGMADCSEIFTTLNEIGALDGYPVIQLLCVSQYPTPLKDANLSRIKTLQNLLPNIPIGFSDHTEGSIASATAVALGAVFIEKHFTLDKNLPGPDHWFSADPKELHKLVEACHLAYECLGSAQLRPSKAEIDMRKIARRSIVAISDISKGEYFQEENIALRRPGTGLPPSYMNEVIGKKSKTNITKGTIISFSDLS